MRISLWGKRGFRKEVATNPEVFIVVILLCLATLWGRGLPGALGFYQIWGLSVALGALWVLVFPRYLRDLSGSDVVSKSIFLVTVGAAIIFADWVAGLIDAIKLIPAGGNGSIEIPAWTLVIGGLVSVSGLLGVVLCKRLSRAIRSCSRIVLRICAGAILVVAIFLVAEATKAGLELLRVGTSGQ